MPEQRSGTRESTTDPVRIGGSLRPVPFDRLLSVAVLTPAQATLVAVQLLDAAEMNGVDGEHRTARLGAVTLTATGVLDVARPHSDQGTRVTELLRQLLQNARRLPAHPRQEQLTLLHSLEEVTRDSMRDPGAWARELEGVLTETLGPRARQRVSAQLAALVDAFAQVTPGAPGPADTSVLPALAKQANGTAVRGSRSLAAAARPVPTQPSRRTRTRLRSRRRGRRMALVVLVLAALLVAGGYFYLTGPGARFNPFGGDHKAASGSSSTAGHHAKKSAHQPKHHHLKAVQTVAPRHAGAVTGVVLRKIGRCKLGTTCHVKVTVHFHRASTARPVGWKVGAARLCKHGMYWSGRSAVTARPGWSKVFAHSSVRVPKGRSLALVAVTTTPARAQSRPVPVSGSSLRC